MSLAAQYSGDSVDHRMDLSTRDRGGECLDARWTMPTDVDHTSYFSQNPSIMWLDSSGTYQFHYDVEPAAIAQEEYHHEFSPSTYFSSASPESPDPRTMQTASEPCDAPAAPVFHHDDKRFSYPAVWAQEVVHSTVSRRGASSEEYRATIARHSDNFLASASSLSFSGSSIPRYNFSTGNPFPSRGPFTQPQSFVDHSVSKRKRPSEGVEVPVPQEQTLEATCLPDVTDEGRYLLEPPMIVPSQTSIAGNSHLTGPYPPFRLSPDHTRQPSPTMQDSYRDHPRQSSSPDPSVLLRDDPAEVPSTKRLHRSEERAATRAPWSTSSETVMKLSAPKKNGDKKQALACLFCRERKIACGRPSATSSDQTCNQCARRRIKCEYPTESRRGQHKRIRRKTQEGEEGITQTSSLSPPVSTPTASPPEVLPQASFSQVPV